MSSKLWLVLSKHGSHPLIFCSGEEAAGGHDVFAPRGTDGAGDAVGVEVVAESGHGRRRSGLVGGARRGMESDEVDPTGESMQQPHCFGGVAQVVVETSEHGVLKRYAPLSAPVVALEQLHHISNGIRFLHGHDLQALVGEGVVEADGQVALALIEKAPQAGDDADAGDGDAAGAPAEAPGGGEHFGAAQHGVEVVHRLAHAHIDDVGEAVELGDGENLVEDVVGAEAAVESLLAGDAEAAAHLAAGLTRDAQCGAVAVGDEHRFDEPSSEDLEKVLLGSVLGELAADGAATPDVGDLAEPGAGFEREVGHGVDGGDALAVEPVANLPCGEAGHAFCGAELLELAEGEAEEVGHVTSHTRGLLRALPAGSGCSRVRYRGGRWGGRSRRGGI